MKNQRLGLDICVSGTRRGKKQNGKVNAPLQEEAYGLLIDGSCEYGGLDNEFSCYGGWI